jgi:hypothetical protein
MKTLALLLFVFACSDGPPDPADLKDGGMNGNDGSVGPGGPEFMFEVAAGTGTEALIGDNAVMALRPDGRPGIAYGYVAAGSATREIHLAERAADGTWSTERVVIPGMNAPSGGDLVGLGFDYVDGVPHVAYVGGDDDMLPTTPFPTDLMLSTRQGTSWSERLLVDNSAEAMADCPGTQNYCNFGVAVGTHAALAAKPGGFAVVYRDTHNAFARDDFARSDTEVYAEGGPFTNSNVDDVRGAGAYGDVAWLPNGNPIVAYNLEEPHPQEDRLGVWAAFYDGATWNLRRVSPSQTSARVSLAVDAAGIAWLAMFHADSADLVVARSMNGGDTWETEIVDGPGKTGLHPAIAIDLEGRPVVAYTYCGPQSEGDCPGSLTSKSEVRLARLEGGEWKQYTVDDGSGFGFVGLFNSIAVLPDGKLAVSFQNTRNSDLIFTREL